MLSTQVLFKGSSRLAHRSDIRMKKESCTQAMLLIKESSSNINFRPLPLPAESYFLGSRWVKITTLFNQRQGLLIKDHHVMPS